MRTAMPVVFGIVVLACGPVLIGLCLLAIFSDDPYDDIFVAVNDFLPGPVRNYACDRIEAHFPDAMAPLTCQDV